MPFNSLRPDRHCLCGIALTALDGPYGFALRDHPRTRTTRTTRKTRKGRGKPWPDLLCRLVEARLELPFGTFGTWNPFRHVQYVPPSEVAQGKEFGGTDNFPQLRSTPEHNSGTRQISRKESRPDDRHWMIGNHARLSPKGLSCEELPDCCTYWLDWHDWYQFDCALRAPGRGPVDGMDIEPVSCQNMSSPSAKISINFLTAH